MPWFELRVAGRVLVWMEAPSAEAAPIAIVGLEGESFQRFALSYVSTYGLSVQGVASTIRSRSAGLYSSDGPPVEGVIWHRIAEGVSQSYGTVRPFQSAHERLLRHDARRERDRG